MARRQRRMAGLGGIVIQRNIVGRESGGLWKEGTVVDGFVKVADFAAGLLPRPIELRAGCDAFTVHRARNAAELSLPAGDKVRTAQALELNVGRQYPRPPFLAKQHGC